MSTIAGLDQFVERAFSKLVIPKDLSASFNANEPGKGNFFLKGTFNAAKFTYIAEGNGYSSISLNALDALTVRTNKDVIEMVTANELGYHFQKYHSDKNFTLEQREEREDAKKFGAQMVTAVQTYVNKRIPGILSLIEGYQNRSLLPEEQQPKQCTLKEIFDRFDLRVSE